MPTISVIITVHGVVDYLDRCLDSVLSQPGVEDQAEFIAVNDASADGSDAVLARRHDHRLKVISTASAVGPGQARELGAKEAAGEYLWFVDGDDELADGALATVVGAVDRLRPDVLNVNYENIFTGGRVTPSGTNLSVPELTTIAESPVLLDVTMSMWNKVFRRDFLAGLGVPFGPGIYEEIPLVLLAMLTAPRLGVLDQVCYRYRRSRSGSFMGTVSDRHLEIFAAYDTFFAVLSERSGQAELTRALTPAVRAALFARTMRHYAFFALPKVPRSSRRDFFRRMTRDYRRWCPEGFTIPPGPRGVELRLVGRGAYRTYSALIPLNRLRLALRQRLR